MAELLINAPRNGTDTTPQRVPLLLELGTTGLKQQGGYVREEWLRELIGQRGMRIYREMADNDATVGAILFAIEMLIRQVAWTVQPASQDNLALEHAEFVRTALFEDMSQSWPMLLSEILSFLPYGFSYHELVYKRRTGDQPPRGAEQDPAWATSQYEDGLLAWRKIPIRAQETVLQWQFDDAGGLQGMQQQDPYAGASVFIPIDKALLFRAGSWKGNPEGRSIIRNAYLPWYRKKHIEIIEGIGIERDLAGLPVIGAPVEYFAPENELTETQLHIMTMMKKIVTSIRRDEQEGVVFPLMYDQSGHELFKLSLLATGGQRAFDTDKIIQRYDVRIAQTVLADVIMIGHQAVGSYALSEDKRDFFSLALSGIADVIAEVFNRHAIPRVWQLNALPKETRPSLTHGRIKRVDIDKFTQAVLRLAQAGLDVTKDEAYIRSELGFPELAIEETGL